MMQAATSVIRSKVLATNYCRRLALKLQVRRTYKDICNCVSTRLYGTVTDEGTERIYPPKIQTKVQDIMGEKGFVVRLRGLPWSATPQDVEKFFDGCEINEGVNGVHLTYSRKGRPSGEAFVEFVSEDSVQAALQKNKEHLGQRYIEVFRSKKGEMERVIKRAGFDSPNMSEAVVKLRGLPFGCSKEEIAQFFTGFEIVPNGIMLPVDQLGRSTGEALVQFASQEIAEKALGKHKERIGHRYIEIFRSSMSEANAVFDNQRGGFKPPMGSGMGVGRPSPNNRNDRFDGSMGPGMGMGSPMGIGFNRGRGGRNLKGSHYISKTGHSVHMRGMPFLAIEKDVFDFFAPIQPVRVEFEYGSDGRRTGKANVDFATHQEALEAMKKHRSNMQHRYIELFLNSTPTRGGSDMGNYGSDMGGGFSSGNMGGESGSFGYGAGSNSGGGYGMESGAGEGYGNQGGFNGGQFSSSSSGGGYGMGGSMGSGGGYGMGGSMGSGRATAEE